MISSGIRDTKGFRLLCRGEILLFQIELKAGAKGSAIVIVAKMRKILVNFRKSQMLGQIFRGKK